MLGGIKEDGLAPSLTSTNYGGVEKVVRRRRRRRREWMLAAHHQSLRDTGREERMRERPSGRRCRTELGGRRNAAKV